MLAYSKIHIADIDCPRARVWRLVSARSERFVGWPLLMPWAGTPLELLAGTLRYMRSC